MHIIKLSLILVFSVALISCGGGGGGSAESVAPTPPAPKLTVNNTGEFDYDKDWNIELNATGLDSASVAYSIDNLPLWMTLDSVSGLLSGEGGIPGDYRLVAKASDSSGASISTTFDISFKLNFTGFWIIDSLPENNALNYGQASNAKLFISRGGYTELSGTSSPLVSSSVNPQGSRTQRCTGITTTSQLNVEVNLNCVTYTFENSSSEIIEYFNYRITGTLELESLIDGETSDLTIEKLNTEDVILAPQRQIYINSAPFYTEESSDNSYLVWVDEQFKIDGLYYLTFNGDRATILKDGNIKTIKISENNPFANPSTNPVYESIKDTYSGLWELNSQCDISGEYNNIDSQWFENYDGENAANHNTVIFADASLTISGCQQNYGTNQVNGTFNSLLTLVHSSQAVIDNGYDSDFSDSEYFQYQVVTGDDQLNASYFADGSYKICQEGKPSIYALWRLEFYGNLLNTSITTLELEEFCEEFQ
jgi:hypothetical protein